MSWISTILRRARASDVAARHDPAPTKLSYQLHRFMLTPSLRKLVFRWLPIGVGCAGLGLIAAMPGNQERIRTLGTEIITSFHNLDAFQVQSVEIVGASAALERQLRATLPSDLPQSRFNLDLEWLRGAVLDIPAVKSARLAVDNAYILQVVIEERLPVALWRNQNGLALVDAQGVVLGNTDARSDHKDLLIIAGAGADRAIADLPALQRALGPLRSRLVGFERRGARRWDVVLDQSQRIMLPEFGAIEALERAAALAQVSDLFARDLRVVDLRLPARPTIRLSNVAYEALVEVRKVTAAAVKEQ